MTGGKKIVQLFAIRPCEAKPFARAANSRDKTALEVALKIKDQVELLRANSSQKRNERPRRVAAIVNDELIDPSMATKEGF
jgi:hypothetical protein